MLSKDLTITVTGDEAVVLTIKTVSATGTDKVYLNTEPGVYLIEDLEKALQEVRTFHYINNPKVEEYKTELGFSVVSEKFKDYVGSP